MNDIIVFENEKPPFSQISTLESVLEKMRSGRLFFPAKGPVIIGGMTWFLGEQSRDWEPKRGDRWKLWKDS